jgi:hypothetical protein
MSRANFGARHDELKKPVSLCITRCSPLLRTQTLVKELNESLQLGMDGTTQLKFIRGIYTSHLDVYIE